MRVVCGLALFTACVLTPPAARGQEPTAEKLLAALEEKLKAAAAAAGPCLATVVVSRSEHYPRPPAGSPPGKLGGFDPRQFLKDDTSPERVALAVALDLSDVRQIPDHGYAGGVVVDAEGYVLTPYHVIDGATRVYVFLSGGGGSYADVHAADARADLAVLKLITPPAKLQAVKFADVRTVPAGNREATVFPGKLCVLMASPYSSTFGIGRPSAAFGSVTSVRHKSLPKDDKAGSTYPEYGPLLEYDLKTLGAADRPRGGLNPVRGGLNAGTTGGALFNLDGEMIGLTNAAAVAWGNEVGPGYAVAADAHFRRIVGVLRKGEEVEYGFLGVTLPQAGNRQRVVVGGLTPLGPAAVALIQEGDVITHVDDLPVDTFDDLLVHVGSALAGAKVRVKVMRFGQPREFPVTLAKFGHPMPFIASVRPDAVFGLRVDHSSILAIKTGGAVEPGACVREVADDSPAAKQFKTLGDDPRRWLVTHVNGAAVANPGGFYQAARGQDKVKLALLDPKDGTRRELTLP